MKTWSLVARIVYILQLSGYWWLSFYPAEGAVQHFVTTIKVSEDNGDYVMQFSKSGASRFSEDRDYNVKLLCTLQYLTEAK